MAQLQEAYTELSPIAYGALLEDPTSVPFTYRSTSVTGVLAFPPDTAAATLSVPEAVEPSAGALIVTPSGVDDVCD